MSFLSRFRHHHQEPMKIEGGVAYYPNRSAIRAIKEVERAERGEIELEEYVPYSSRNAEDDHGHRTAITFRFRKRMKRA